MQKHETLNIRLEEELLIKIDTFRDELGASIEGLKPTRSAAVRVLVEAGLKAIKMQKKGSK